MCLLRFPHFPPPPKQPRGGTLNCRKEPFPQLWKQLPVFGANKDRVVGSFGKRVGKWKLPLLLCWWRRQIISASINFSRGPLASYYSYVLRTYLHLDIGQTALSYPLWRSWSRNKKKSWWDFSHFSSQKAKCLKAVKALILQTGKLCPKVRTI